MKLLSNKVADLLLQNTYGDGFCIFAAANITFQLNLVLLLAVAPVFVPDSFENTSQISEGATSAVL